MIDAPETWPEVHAMRIKAQKAVLIRGGKYPGRLKDKAAHVEMESTNFYNTCRRFGINPWTGEET